MSNLTIDPTSSPSEPEDISIRELGKVVELAKTMAEELDGVQKDYSAIEYLRKDYDDVTFFTALWFAAVTMNNADDDWKNFLIEMCKEIEMSEEDVILLWIEDGFDLIDGLSETKNEKYASLIVVMLRPTVRRMELIKQIREVGNTILLVGLAICLCAVVISKTAFFYSALVTILIYFIHWYFHLHRTNVNILRFEKDNIMNKLELEG